MAEILYYLFDLDNIQFGSSKIKYEFPWQYKIIKLLRRDPKDPHSYGWDIRKHAIIAITL